MRGGAKSVALVAAALFFAAQLLALAHNHQGNPTRRFEAQSQVVADDALCALCLLAFHAPLNPSATPAIARPYAEPRLVDCVIADRQVSISFSSYQTRAPPAATV